MVSENKVAKPRSRSKKAVAAWSDGPSVYVNSAGYGHRDDFRWREWTGPSTGPAGGAKEQLDRLVEIAGSQTISSVYIERKGGRLRMMVCNLPGTRQDVMGRPIANALALFGDDNAATERRVRRVAAAMLGDTPAFAEAMDSAVVGDDGSETTGWTIDGVKMSALLNGPAGELESETPSDPYPRTAALSDASARSLGRELAASTLPIREGILVFVAPHLPPSALDEMRVWRGISAHPSVMQAGGESIIPRPGTALAAGSQIGRAGYDEVADDRASAIQDGLVAASIASAFLLLISAIVWNARPR